MNDLSNNIHVHYYSLFITIDLEQLIVFREYWDIFFTCVPI